MTEEGPSLAPDFIGACGDQRVVNDSVVGFIECVCNVWPAPLMVYERITTDARGELNENSWPHLAPYYLMLRGNFPTYRRKKIPQLSVRCPKPGLLPAHISSEYVRSSQQNGVFFINTLTEGYHFQEIR